MSTFSHSRISAFETCPKKYEFSYILNEPKGPSGIEAFMGSRVHEALEWLYREVRACRLPDEEATVARFQQAWDDEWDDEVRVVRSDRTAEDYRAIGEKAVRDYHRRYQPFDQGVTVGLESRVRVALDDDHEIIGYIDRLTKVADGVWEIHDYKTSNSLPTQESCDADRQLALYELAVREMYPDAREVTLVWHYLVFDHESRSTRTPEQLEALRAEVLGAVRAIEAQTEFATRTSTLCGWCDYRAVCPAWRHEAAVREPQAEAVPDDGASLADEYLALCAEISQLKARQDEVRDAIALFADANRLDRVFGSQGSLKVFRYQKVSIPESSDPRRSEFEQRLRELGLWERFATLNAYGLSRAIGDGSLAGGDLEQIEAYLDRSPGVKLYSSSR